MPAFLMLVTYSPAGAAGAIREGLVARRAAYEAVVLAHGGSLLRYDVVAEGSCDLAIVTDWPDDDPATIARMRLAFTAAGAVDELRVMRLTTAEAFDAASRATETAYRPPSTRS